MLEPVGYYVLVKPDPVETKSAGGIVLAIDEKKYQAAQIFGTVVAVGPCAYAQDEGKAPWVYSGDRVAYAKYAGKPVTDPDTAEEYLVVIDSDITTKVTK